MREDEILTSFEGFSLLSMMFLYHLFNEILPSMVEIVGTAAWMARLFAMLMAFVVLGLYLFLSKLYPGSELLDICGQAYGKVAGKVMQLLILVFLFLFASSCLNQMVELMHIYSYAEVSSLEIDILILIAVSAFGLYSIKGMGKTVSILWPVIYLSVVVIVVMSYKQYDPNLIFPLFGYGAKNLAFSSFRVTSEYTGIMILALYWNAFKSRRAFAKSAGKAILYSGGLIVFSSICYNMAIPYNAAKDFMMGLIGIAQSSHNSRFVQRLESVFIAFSVVAVILLTAITFLAIQKTYCHIFHIKKKYASCLLFPISVLLICLERTMDSTLAIEQAVRFGIRRYSIVFVLGFVLLTLLVTLLKRTGQRMKWRFAGLTLVCCMALAMFSGCGHHYEEPDAVVYPVIMGYEKGEKERLKITFKLMTDHPAADDPGPSKKEGSGQEEVPANLFVVEAPTFSEGINLINTITPKRISLLHVKLIVISEELAREGLEGFVPTMTRYTELKPSIALVVCDGSSYDFINASDHTLSNSIQLEMELFLSRNKETTAYYIVTLGDFLNDLESKYGHAIAMYGGVSQQQYPDPGKVSGSPAEQVGSTPAMSQYGYLPGEIPVAGKNKSEFAGMSVFRDGKFVGPINTLQCETLMILNDSFKKGHYIAPDPLDPENYCVSLQIHKNKPVKVKSYIDEDGTAHVKITVVINGRIGIAKNPNARYNDNAGQREVLREHLENNFKKEAEELLDLLQNEYRADVLQLGRHVARNFLTIQKWEEYNWCERFQDADISLDIRFMI